MRSTVRIRAVPAWAEDLADRPLVHATPGTVFTELSYRAAVLPGRVGRAPWRTPRPDRHSLARTPDPASPEYASNVHVERYVPQSLLFPGRRHCLPRRIRDASSGGRARSAAPGGSVRCRPVHSTRPASSAWASDVIDEDDLTTKRMRSVVTTLLEDDGYRDNVRKLRDAAGRLPPASAWSRPARTDGPRSTAPCSICAAT